MSGEGQTSTDGEADALYEALKVYEGRAAVTAGRGRDPVNEPMIRHWCEATGHPVPPDGSAPVTMLQVWTMGGLSGHVDRSGPYDALLGALDEAGCTSVVATDCEQEYLRDLRPGDEVTFDAVIESVSPRKTTKLGTGHFVTTRMDVHADGELAGTHRFRILKYAPPQRKPGAGGKAEGATSAGGQGGRSGSPRRPRPVVNRDNAGFWEGVARHVLLIQRCEDCAVLRFPWLPGCNACGSSAWSAVEASGGGTVYSYVVMHHPPFPAFTATEEEPGGTGGPYAVGLVELAEGVRVISNITGVPHDKVRIGMPVTLEFQDVDEELVLPVFRAGEGTA